MAKQRLTRPVTLIEKWARMVGFDRRKLGEAARLIGLNAVNISQRNQNLVKTSQAEKMAMTAAWLGLPEFSNDIYNLPEMNRDVALAAAVVIRKALAGENVHPTGQESQPAEAAQQADAGQET